MDPHQQITSCVISKPRVVPVRARALGSTQAPSSAGGAWRDLENLAETEGVNSWHTESSLQSTGEALQTGEKAT